MATRADKGVRARGRIVEVVTSQRGGDWYVLCLEGDKPGKVRRRRLTHFDVLPHKGAKR